MVSVTDILSTISDDKALSLFKAVALSENDCSSILITDDDKNHHQNLSLCVLKSPMSLQLFIKLHIY